MSTLSWILTGLFCVALALYILSLFKNFKIISGITSVLFIPLSCTPIILSLSDYLPDSYHIRFLSIIAVSCIAVSEFFIYFNFTKAMTYLGEFFYIASFLFWIQLYKTTFFIFRVSLSALITESVILFLLLVILLIYIRKQKPLFYLVKLFEYFSLGFLNFSAIITEINVSGHGYTVTFIIGSILLIIEYVLYTVQTTRPVEINRKIERAVRTSLITTAQIMLTLTGLLMIR